MPKRTAKIIVSLEELQAHFLAADFDVSKKWINELTKKKGLPKLERGKYDLVDCLKWMGRYRKQQLDGAESERHGKAKAEEDLLIAKARREENKLRKETGQLVNKAKLIEEMQKLLFPIRDLLLRFADRINPLIDGKTAIERKAIIDQMMYDALNEFAELPAKSARVVNRRARKPKHRGSITANIPGGLETPAAPEPERMG